MATLDSSFESDLQEALMDEAEGQLYDNPDNMAFAFLQLVNENIRDFANEQDYDLESIAESGRVTDTSRGNTRVSVTLEWDHPAAIFEWGAPPHTIEGNPILSFVWEDPPDWVKQEYEREGDGWRVFFPSVEHPGVPAGRFLRGAVNRVRFGAQGGEIRL